LKALASGLKQAATEIDPQLTLTNVVPFTEIVNRSLMVERLVARVASAFALLALLIAGIGSYGVLAHSVVRRRKEIGIRIAVGAERWAVEWMILRESLGLLGIGFLLGVPVAIVVTRFVSSMLFGLKHSDPATIAVSLAILTATTVIAAYLPARQAAKVDPLEALRSD
jgi:ABC-type antimicrobial peptide transport system permease subunit